MIVELISELWTRRGDDHGRVFSMFAEVLTDVAVRVRCGSETVEVRKLDPRIVRV